MQAFKKGVYNYIKEEPVPGTSERIPKKYFSGGFDAALISPSLESAPKNWSPASSDSNVLVLADLAMVAKNRKSQIFNDELGKNPQVALSMSDQEFLNLRVVEQVGNKPVWKLINPKNDRTYYLKLGEMWEYSQNAMSYYIASRAGVGLPRMRLVDEQLLKEYGKELYEEVLRIRTIFGLKNDHPDKYMGVLTEDVLDIKASLTGKGTLEALLVFNQFVNNNDIRLEENQNVHPRDNRLIQYDWELFRPQVIGLKMQIMYPPNKKNHPLRDQWRRTRKQIDFERIAEAVNALNLIAEEEFDQMTLAAGFEKADVSWSVFNQRARGLLDEIMSELNYLHVPDLAMVSIRNEIFGDALLSDKAKDEIRALFTDSMFRRMGWTMPRDQIRVEERSLSKEGGAFISLSKSDGSFSAMTESYKLSLDAEGDTLWIGRGSFDYYEEYLSDPEFADLDTDRKLLWWMERRVKPFAKRLGFKKIAIFVYSEISDKVLTDLGYEKFESSHENSWFKEVDSTEVISASAHPEEIKDNAQLVDVLNAIAEGQAPTAEQLGVLERIMGEDPVQLAFQTQANQPKREIVEERIRILQKCWKEFSFRWKEYLHTDTVPIDTLWRFYIPLSQWMIAQKRAHRPNGVYILGIQAKPGVGKTTLSHVIVPVLNALLLPSEGQALPRSMDDYYLFKRERDLQRNLYEGEHLKFFRGPPGTHDIERIRSDFERFDKSTDDSETELIQFDKTIDDRSSQPVRIKGKVGVVLFEGGYMGTNTNFKVEDLPPGLKRVVGEELQKHKPIFDRLDGLVVFDIPGEDTVAMRLEQERLLGAKTGRRGATDEQIRQFMQYVDGLWEPGITSDIPDISLASFKVSLNKERKVLQIIRGNRDFAQSAQVKDEAMISAINHKFPREMSWTFGVKHAQAKHNYTVALVRETPDEYQWIEYTVRIFSSTENGLEKEVKFPIVIARVSFNQESLQERRIDISIKKEKFEEFPWLYEFLLEKVEPQLKAILSENISSVDEKEGSARDYQLPEYGLDLDADIEPGESRFDRYSEDRVLAFAYRAFESDLSKGGFAPMQTVDQEQVLKEGDDVVNVAFFLGDAKEDEYAFLEAASLWPNVNAFIYDGKMISTPQKDGSELFYAKPRFMFHNGKPVFIKEPSLVPIHYLVRGEAVAKSDERLQNSNLPTVGYVGDQDYTVLKDISMMELSHRGVNVPRWRALIVNSPKEERVNHKRKASSDVIFMEDGGVDEIKHELERFLNDNNLEQAVIKPVDGYKGDGVFFFDRTNIEEVALEIKRAFELKKNMIIQERIEPPYLSNGEKDWNLRVFVSQKQKGRHLAKIVRVDQKNRPVNISKGAKGLLLEDIAKELKLSPSEYEQLEQEIDEQSRKAYEAINSSMQEDGIIPKGSNATDYMGVDIIVRKEGDRFKAYVIEVNNFRSGAAWDLNNALRMKMAADGNSIWQQRLGEASQDWLATIYERALAYKESIKIDAAKVVDEAMKVADTKKGKVEMLDYVKLRTDEFVPLSVFKKTKAALKRYEKWSDPSNKIVKLLNFLTFKKLKFPKGVKKRKVDYDFGTLMSWGSMIDLNRVLRIWQQDGIVIIEGEPTVEGILSIEISSDVGKVIKASLYSPNTTDGSWVLNYQDPQYPQDINKIVRREAADGTMTGADAAMTSIDVVPEWLTKQGLHIESIKEGKVLRIYDDSGNEIYAKRDRNELEHRGYSLARDLGVNVPDFMFLDEKAVKKIPALTGFPGARILVQPTNKITADQLSEGTGIEELAVFNVLTGHWDVSLEKEKNLYWVRDKGVKRAVTFDFEFDGLKPDLVKFPANDRDEFLLDIIMQMDEVKLAGIVAKAEKLKFDKKVYFDQGQLWLLPMHMNKKRVRANIIKQLKTFYASSEDNLKAKEKIDRLIAALQPPTPASGSIDPTQGGIDLTSNKFLQTQNQGETIKFKIDPAMLQQLQNAPGFYPVIINIQPITNLPEFLGLPVQGLK